ncbi:GerAB/ArcD/ProY family transporter [Gottfriedia luciferensis]|uniref:GerAB/ArcD/ProY family transporter n=1 Tax=Gottfriedia luciferensis TaxID=178774 RepID=UPI000B4440D2|nr:endospore germination permease [Gottfriedia luciferensis]
MEGTIMNRKLNVSGFQLLCMIFMFINGTSPPIEIYFLAKQDSWMSLFLGLTVGCLLFLVYIKLYSFFPDVPFTKYIQYILGKYVGKLLALIYILYFIYIGARVLRNFEELMIISLYNASSHISIGILTMIVVIYASYKGIEVFARANEFIFLFIAFLIFIIIGFEIISGLININNLRPVLESGWKPVLKATPILTATPFGEIFTFTMILPYLNKQKKVVKVGITSLLFSGLILTLFSMLNTSIMGASEIERTIYPLLTAVSYINIADFIQRLDTFIVVVSVCNYFVKITIYFYCAVSGAADLFDIKESKKLVYPTSVIMLVCSIWMSKNYVDLRNQASNVVPFLLQIPLQIIIPICLILIVLIKRKLKYPAL